MCSIGYQAFEALRVLANTGLTGRLTERLPVHSERLRSFSWCVGHDPQMVAGHQFSSNSFAKCPQTAQDLQESRWGLQPLRTGSCRHETGVDQGQRRVSTLLPRMVVAGDNGSLAGG